MIRAAEQWQIKDNKNINRNVFCFQVKVGLLLLLIKFKGIASKI